MVEFEYGNETWECETWLDRIKCPIEGTTCKGSTETISGMKCHLNMRHNIDEVVERECEGCGETFTFSLTEGEKRKFCSIPCANASMVTSD